MLNCCYWGIKAIKHVQFSPCLSCRKKCYIGRFLSYQEKLSLPVESSLQKYTMDEYSETLFDLIGFEFLEELITENIISQLLFPFCVHASLTLLKCAYDGPPI